MPDDLSGFENDFRIALLEKEKRDERLRLATLEAAIAQERLKLEKKNLERFRQLGDEIAALRKKMDDLDEEMRWRGEEQKPLPKMIVLRRRTK